MFSMTSHTAISSRRIGEALVANGTVTQADVEHALAVQKRTGSQLGRILLLDGRLERRDLYRGLALCWGLPFVDLITDPPRPEMLEGLEPTQLSREHWVPWKKRRGKIIVACATRPDEALITKVCMTLGMGRKAIVFVVTTDWDVDKAILTGFKEVLHDRAADELARDQPALSAASPYARWQMNVLIIFLIGLVATTIVDWHATLVIIVIACNVIFLAGALFKLVVCLAGAWRINRLEDARLRRHARGERREYRAEADLPMYTILVPAYHEPEVIKEVLVHLSKLDYPAEKLQVLVLLEEDDEATITATQTSNPPEYMRIIMVPAGSPRTKAKACNVGMTFAEGEFIVIYDAEDQPEPSQLKEAVAEFDRAGDNTVCVQARLNYHNWDVNILTRMFTLEYSFWFDYLVPGLDALGLPIPLGGTSNHFRTEFLRSVGDWDPYNVTEDADLGIRSSLGHHHIGVIDSTTWEEACSQVNPWVKQRTRWTKGYMVTALVHSRHPISFVKSCGARGLVGLVGLIAGTPLTFLVCPLMWLFTLVSFFATAFVDSVMPGWLATVTVLSFVIGNGMVVAICMLGCWRRRLYRLAPFALLNPFYWVLHSIAAWRAVYQLIRHPFVWEKTPHGLVYEDLS